MQSINDPYGPFHAPCDITNPIIKMWNEESRGNPPYTISKYKVEMFINNQPGIPFPEIPDELVTYVYPSNELTTTIYP